MQIACIRQLNAMIRRYKTNKAIVAMCNAELKQRKYWAMHPSEVGL